MPTSDVLPSHDQSGPASPAVNLHATEIEQALQQLQANREQGLTSEEARHRSAQYGPNRLTARQGTPAWVKFLLQFHQPLVYLLLAATVITALLGEWVDSGVILAVVIVNALIGYLQESKAEKAIEALSRMVVTETMVKRDGQTQRLPSEQLVPGDIVILQAGDKVPADLRLLQVKGLQIEEAALTGESVPVHKAIETLPPDTVLADRRNLAFAGTLVTAGQGEGVVSVIGDATETGRIATLMSETVDLTTPLTKKIAEFSQLLMWVILGLSVVVFGIGVLRGHPVAETFMAAVALAVGAIPEGLPAAVTIVLAIGVSRMAKRRAIIRKLPAVETLGSTTIICSDKTGTLTQNEMTVTRLWAAGETVEVTGSGYNPAGELQTAGRAVHREANQALMETLRAGLLCNESNFSQEEGRWKSHGDPTEAALLVAATKAGMPHNEVRQAWPRTDMIPFDSEYMYRATLHEHDGLRVIYLVGALERLLDRCTETLDASGKTTPLAKGAIHTASEQLAGEGLRVLAMARRVVRGEQGKLEHSDVEQGLTFLGLQGMLDPPRPEVIQAIARCQSAGIRVKMITGDHLTTATAIARKIGLNQGDVAAKSGRELEQISDQDLPGIAESTAVFARVAPEQKLRLVRALQSRGHVIAMTGDGVNDAPALKQANIGVAMGITGTDVSKNAAAMILTDDNFASIEAAVEEGRGVYDNLVKFIVWTLPTNAGEAVILIAAIVFGTTLPMLPVQILWNNLSTTVLLGTMLAFEPKESDLMQRPPRDPRQPLMTTALLMRTAFVSVLTGVGAFWLFYWETTVQGRSVEQARTAVANVIIFVECFYLFNCRSLTHSVFHSGLFSNPIALAGIVAMVVAQLLFTYLPLMNTLFHTAPLPAVTWVPTIGIALCVFVAVEIEKWLRFHNRRFVNPT